MGSSWVECCPAPRLLKKGPGGGFAEFAGTATPLCRRAALRPQIGPGAMSRVVARQLQAAASSRIVTVVAETLLQGRSNVSFRGHGHAANVEADRQQWAEKRCRQRCAR